MSRSGRTVASNLVLCRRDCCISKQCSQSLLPAVFASANASIYALRSAEQTVKLKEEHHLILAPVISNLLLLLFSNLLLLPLLILLHFLPWYASVLAACLAALPRSQKVIWFLLSCSHTLSLHEHLQQPESRHPALRQQAIQATCLFMTYTQHIVHWLVRCRERISPWQCLAGI